MAARRGRRRRHQEEEHADERWLLTYADMITLLMALFMVLFSISSVNTSKFESLQKALQDAFSGKILPNGEAVKESGAQANTPAAATQPPSPSLRQVLGGRQGGAQAAQREQRELQQLQDQIQALAARKGLTDKVQTKLDARGLQVRLLTDDLLFSSGSADINPRALPLMTQLGRMLRTEGIPPHAIRVEGHTDDVPIRGSAYPSNWELSTARASAVVRALARAHVAPARMEAAGRAYLDPTATNATATGRATNRRVEIFLPRREDSPAREAPTK